MLSRYRNFWLLMIFCAILIGLSPAHAARFELRLSDVLPEDNFLVRGEKLFAAEVNRETGGEVYIRVFAGGLLGLKGVEQIRAVRDGTVQMANIVASQQVSDAPFLGVEGIPFLVRSQKDLKILHKFVRAEFERIAESQYKQKILYMVPSPPQYLFLKVRADKLNALNGIKVRGADESTVSICNAIGLKGVQIPLPEFKSALTVGLVDGVATSATTAVDAKAWESLKYIYATNHTWSSNMVTINLDVWKKLPEKHRLSIERIAAKVETALWDEASAANAESLRILKSNGMEEVTISPEMMADIRTRTKPLQDRYLARVPTAAPLIRNYLSELK